MAAFEYRAIDTQGRVCRGVISADSAVAARRSLRQRELSPIQVDETTQKAVSKSRELTGGGRPLNLNQRVLLTRQLSVMIGAGTPVEEALAMVGRHSQQQNMRLVLARLRAAVNEGQSLGRALASERGSFPPLYSAAVSAGETAGALDTVLEDLAEYLEKSAASKRRLLSVIAYPSVVALVAISVAVALLVLVVPQLAEQLGGLGQDLPGLTKAMLSISSFIRQYGLMFLVGLGVFGLVMGRAMQLESMRRHRDQFILSLPLFGRLLRDSATARFCRGLSTLIRNGAPVIDAVTAARGGLALLPLQIAADHMLQQLREGVSLSAGMLQTEAFPPLAVYMIRGGEASGNLGMALERAASYMEEQFESTASLALALLEPAITVLMGGVVLLIILSVMLPILQLNSAILG